MAKKRDLNEFEDDATAEVVDVDGESAAPAGKKSRKNQYAEIVPQVREMRAIPSDENPEKPKYTHSQIADHFGLRGGFVSMICRNKVHIDESYEPKFDGMRDTGPRLRDEDGKVVSKVKLAKLAKLQDAGTETGEVDGGATGEGGAAEEAAA